MKVDRKIKNSIISFLNNYYENSYACLLSGSYVDGKSNEYSDLDVLIFTRDRNVVFNETLSYENLKLQAIVIPVQSIQELLWVDHITGKGAFINMIQKGQIIFDTSHFLADLISHAKELQSLGGRILTDYEIYMMRVKITSLLMDVKGGGNTDELFFSMAGMLDVLTELKLRRSGNWCGEGKYRSRQIKKLDSEFYEEMNMSLKQAYAFGNKIPFIEFIEREMDSHGGLLSYYSRANALSQVSHDYLVVEIDTGNRIDADKIKNTLKMLLEFTENLTTHKLKYYYFSSNAVEINKKEQNIYFVIDAGKEVINDYLIDRLNFLVHNRTGISKLQFPFQFDTRFKFSNDQIYLHLAPIFYKASALMNSNKLYNPAAQLEFSILLMRHVRTYWFENKSDEFISFLNYTMQSWLPLTYDDGTAYTTLRLLKNRDGMLEKFESMFEQQKLNLEKLYFSKKVLDRDFTDLLNTAAHTPDVESIPSYKTYLLEDNLTAAKKWSLYKEVLFRVFSIALIDNRFISYVPFVLKKIVLKND